MTLILGENVLIFRSMWRRINRIIDLEFKTLLSTKQEKRMLFQRMRRKFCISLFKTNHPHRKAPVVVPSIEKRIIFFPDTIILSIRCLQTIQLCQRSKHFRTYFSLWLLFLMRWCTSKNHVHSRVVRTSRTLLRVICKFVLKRLITVRDCSGRLQLF